MSRVNARLDQPTSEKLGYLRVATGLNLSDVVRESVQRDYAEVRAEANRRDDGLSALVGAFDGHPETPVDRCTDYQDRRWSLAGSGPDTDADPVANPPMGSSPITASGWPCCLPAHPATEGRTPGTGRQSPSWLSIWQRPFTTKSPQHTKIRSEISRPVRP